MNTSHITLITLAHALDDNISPTSRLGLFMYGQPQVGDLVVSVGKYEPYNDPHDIRRVGLFLRNVKEEGCYCRVDDNRGYGPACPCTCTLDDRWVEHATYIRTQLDEDTLTETRLMNVRLLRLPLNWQQYMECKS